MGILEAATQRMKMEEASYEARIAALSAELETVKGERDALTSRAYMVCLSCSRPLDEGTWRSIGLPLHAVRCPCGAIGNWARSHSFWKARAAAAEAKLAGGEAYGAAVSLEQQFRPTAGYDKNQPGFHHREGWNAALRHVMDLQRATLTHPVPTHNDGSGERLTPEQVADHIGVTPHSDMRPFVVQAVRYAREQDALSHTSGEVTEAMFRVFLKSDDDDTAFTFAAKGEMDAFLKNVRKSHEWFVTDVHEYECSTAASAISALRGEAS